MAPTSIDFPHALETGAIHGIAQAAATNVGPQLWLSSAQDGILLESSVEGEHSLAIRDITEAAVRSATAAETVTSMSGTSLQDVEKRNGYAVIVEWIIKWVPMIWRWLRVGLSDWMYMSKVALGAFTGLTAGGVITGSIAAALIAHERKEKHQREWEQHQQSYMEAEKEKHMADERAEEAKKEEQKKKEGEKATSTVLVVTKVNVVQKRYDPQKEAEDSVSHFASILDAAELEDSPSIKTAKNVRDAYTDCTHKLDALEGGDKEAKKLAKELRDSYSDFVASGEAAKEGGSLQARDAPMAMKEPIPDFHVTQARLFTVIDAMNQRVSKLEPAKLDAAKSYQDAKADWDRYKAEHPNELALKNLPRSTLDSPSTNITAAKPEATYPAVKMVIISSLVSFGVSAIIFVLLARRYLRKSAKRPTKEATGLAKEPRSDFTKGGSTLAGYWNTQQYIQLSGVHELFYEDKKAALT
ncbi:MAG: hypothetical protein LQ340_001796 [Diploschistes diacapsis]|nr:MAG: hypothetical protein LQ340_001796 [Diploschistes diacapsis]